MNTLRRLSQLQIVSHTEGAFVGSLNDFQFDLAARTVYGWRVKDRGVFGRSGGLVAGEVLMIGRDAVFIGTENSVEWSGAGRNEQAGRAWAVEYRGTTVLSRSGAAKGQVQDYLLDELGGRVEGFLLSGNAVLAIDARVQVGPSAVIIEREDQVEELPSTSDDDTGWWRRLRARKAP